MWLIKQSAACRSRFPNIRDEVIHTTDRSCSVSGLSLESLFFLEAGRALLSFSIEALAAETHNIVTHPYFCMAKQLIMPVSKYVYMHMLWGIQYWNLFIKKHIFKIYRIYSFLTTALRDCGLILSRCSFEK